MGHHVNGNYFDVVKLLFRNVQSARNPVPIPHVRTLHVPIPHVQIVLVQIPLVPIPHVLGLPVVVDDDSVPRENVVSLDFTPNLWDLYLARVKESFLKTMLFLDWDSGNHSSEKESLYLLTVLMLISGRNVTFSQHT